MRLWPKQQQILLALTTEPQIAVRSGQKCGKSLMAAVAALWFWCCFHRAYVILTAPTGRQVREVLWKEVTQLYQNSRVPLGGRMNTSPGGGLRHVDGRTLIGFSTNANKAENMAGPSGAALMYIVDEASGYSQSIFEAIQGNLSGSVVGRLLILSNPTRPAGFFFDAFHRSAESWKGFRISSEEAAKYADEFPGLTRIEKIRLSERERGRDSAWFRIRVLGEFPDKAANAIMSLSDIDAAKDEFLTELLRRMRERWGEDVPEERAKNVTFEECAQFFTEADGPLELGVDVARYGDDRSIIQPRRGRFLLPYRAVHGYDTQEVAGLVLQVCRILRRPHEVARVKVDVIGYGAGVYDALRLPANKELVRPIAVNVSERADDPERYPNLRSQLWFGVAEFLRENAAMHPATGDEEGRLEAELLTPGYKIDPQGRSVVEPKDDIKARLGRSPDVADAVALAVYRARALSPAVPQKNPGVRASRLDGDGWGERGFAPRRIHARVPRSSSILGRVAARCRRHGGASQWREGAHRPRDQGPVDLAPMAARGGWAPPGAGLIDPS